MESFHQRTGPLCVTCKFLHVWLYFTYLLEAGSSYHPVNSAIYGIKWTHEIIGLLDPTKNAYVISLQEYARKIATQPNRIKEHVSIDIIITLSSKYVDCNDLLLLRNMLFGFAGFIRFDEISPLTFGDVEIF